MTYGGAQYPQPGVPVQPRARSRWLFPLIVIAVVALVATVVVVSVHFATRGGGDRAAGGPVEGQLRSTYPTEPVKGWQLAGDDVFDRARFVRPDYISYQYQRPGFIDFGDVLITSAILPQSDKEAELVAIDSATGDVLWRNSNLGFQPVCAEKTIDGLLPCVGREATFGDDAAPTLVSFVGLTDGVIDNQLEASEDASMLLVNGNDVYTVGFGYMARGGRDDLTSAWEQRYSIEGDDGCFGSGDSQYYGVDDEFVYFGSDAGVVMADAATGRRVTESQPQFPELFAGLGFVAGFCASSDPDGEGWTEVYDSSGERLRRLDSQDVAVPWLVSDVRDVPLVVGDTAYDFRSGERLWSVQGEPVRLTGIVGDVVLGNTLADGEYGYPEPDGTVAYDLRTGERLWDSPVTGWGKMSDGQRVMFFESETLAVLNLRTGEREWTLPGLNMYSTAAAGDGFASADPEEITFYPPTGPPSLAPAS